jgi:hypothetical protein
MFMMRFVCAIHKYDTCSLKQFEVQPMAGVSNLDA